MKIAVCQLNFKIGDFENNYQKIIDAVHKNVQNADIIVFSELALSGYYPKDLIERPGFVETQNYFVNKLIMASEHIDIAIIIGLIHSAPHTNRQKNKTFYNSLAFIHQGAIRYQYHKMLLPVYNIFDEARHFSPGEEAGYFHFKGFNLGFLICEDGWQTETDIACKRDPIALLQEKALDLVISINASPSNIGKQQERITQFASVAQILKAPLIFCNQVGGNDDLVFDGASFCLQADGQVLDSLAAFAEDCGIVSLENKCLMHARHGLLKQPLSDVALFYEQTQLGLKDYVTKCGFNSVVIGLSGGIDSALTCALATLALGADKVIALAMPSRYSSEHSISDAIALCERLNIKLHIVSIEEEFKLACTQFSKNFNVLLNPLTEQNIQARIRGRILMQYSNQYGSLVLSTGNKSELSVGYTTLYGDMVGGLNIIGDLYKTEVYALSHYINEIHDHLIPHSIIEKEPSAELAPNQKDSDNLLPYEILDPILRLYLEGDLLSPKQKAAYHSQIAPLSKESIQAVHRQVDLAEFKRKQAPPIIRIQRRAFGMGRQFPIAANFSPPNN
ncbi:MAG: NAD+ synthase [Candidatus Berkiella sp.]